MDCLWTLKDVIDLHFPFYVCTRGVSTGGHGDLCGAWLGSSQRGDLCGAWLKDPLNRINMHSSRSLDRN